jgi:hypothetical protein
MIKIFRKIRKQLVNSNSNSKYLKYAIGEIALVVIGILIALQVNSWNEERQLALKEKKLLFELKNDLIGSKNELIFDLNNLSRILKNSDSIIQYLDTIDAKNYDRIKFGDKMGLVLGNVKLYPRTIAYENLKSYGNELITNDSIRYYVSEVYDRKIPRVKHWETSSVKSENDLYNALSGFLKSKISPDINYNKYLLIPDTFNSKTKKLFINRLAILQNERYGLLYVYEDLLKTVEKLLKLLD